MRTGSVARATTAATTTASGSSISQNAANRQYNSEKQEKAYEYGGQIVGQPLHNQLFFVGL